MTVRRKIVYTTDDSARVISRWTIDADRVNGIYRAAPRAATISVKCVTVEATGKASFDFSAVTINLWFTPFRGEHGCRSANHAWDRPVAKIGLPTFYFVSFLRVRNQTRRTAQRCALRAPDWCGYANSRFHLRLPFSFVPLSLHITALLKRIPKRDGFVKRGN